MKLRLEATKGLGSGGRGTREKRGLEWSLELTWKGLKEQGSSGKSAEARTTQTQLQTSKQGRRERGYGPLFSLVHSGGASYILQLSS